MNNKPQMNTDKHGLVPKLRFPEFKDAEDWVEKKLGEVADFSKGKGLSKSDISENGKTPCIRYGELYTHYNEAIEIVYSYTNIPVINLVLSKSNDVIIPSSGETQEDIATASCIINSGIALGSDLNIIRSKMNGIFLSYYLNSVKKKSIAQLSQGISVVHLYSSQLINLEINIPSLSEQQKIADCLSSLDEVITLHSQKLDTLKEHKKGLLQQLFLREGETVLKLRFPEFKDAGDWEEKKLGEVCEKISQGGTPSTLNQNYWNGDIQWLTPAEMGRKVDRFIISTNRKLTTEGLKNCSSELLPINSVILSTRAPIGHLQINKTEMAINQGCKGLVPKETTSYDFLYYYLFNNKNLLTDLGSGNTFKELSSKALKNFQVKFPSLPEQQKIADCLSSLDEVITLHTQKLDTLKEHKKGLLQQLFPTSEGII